MYFSKARTEFLAGYFSINTRREKTKIAYYSDTKQFQTFIGENFDITALTYTDIERWVAHLKEKSYSPASIRRKIVILKVFCAYWVRQGILKESPFWRVKINFGRSTQLPRTLTKHEMQTLLIKTQKNYSRSKVARLSGRSDAGGPPKPSSRDYLILRNVVLLELFFATGLRVGEVSAIDIADFSAIDASIKVQGKGGKERMAYIVDEVTLNIHKEYLISRLQIETKSPALFLNAMGGRLSTQGIANTLHRLRRESGVDRHLTPHMLRHTIATLLLRNGLDIRVVQEFLGHASIATTQRYTHIAKEHMISELQNRHPSMTFRVTSEFSETGYVKI